MIESYITQDEFKRLDARVSSVEQEADGERMLSRYVLNQSRQNGDDLAILKTRVDRIEGKIDQLEQRTRARGNRPRGSQKRPAHYRRRGDARGSARNGAPLAIPHKNCVKMPHLR